MIGQSLFLQCGRKIMSIWRHSMLSHLLVKVVAPSIRKRPLQDCPGWMARICGIKVPQLVRPHSHPRPEGSANINILLSLLEDAVKCEGDLCECGVFRGSTLIPTGLYLAQHGIEKKVFGCDSFEGFGAAVAIDVQLGGTDCEARHVNGMNSTSQQYVARRLESFGLDARTQLLPGYFENTLHQLADRKFCFVHLDCDMYQSYKTCMEFFYPRMAPGGIILFDEYDDSYWPGCNLAVDEFLVGKIEKPVRIMRDNYVKCFVQKGRAAELPLPVEVKAA